jgi:hypothetical protein
LSAKTKPFKVVVAPTNRLEVEAVVAKKLVVVALVIVALVAVKFATFNILANSVFKTFNQETDDDETVVVANVDVPPETIVEILEFVIVALVIVEFPTTSFPMLANEVDALVEAKLDVVALVTVALVVETPETFSVAMLATPIVAEAIVEVAMVVVANTDVPVAVILLATKLPVVVALVPVAFVKLRLRIVATLANKLVSIFNQETVEVEIVVVPRVVVPEFNVPEVMLDVTAKLPVLVALVPVEFPAASTLKFVFSTQLVPSHLRVEDVAVPEARAPDEKDCQRVEVPVFIKNCPTVPVAPYESRTLYEVKIPVTVALVMVEFMAIKSFVFVVVALVVEAFRASVLIDEVALIVPLLIV